MKRILPILALAVLPLTTHAQQYTPTKAQHAKLLKQRAKIIAMQEKISDLQNEIAYEIEQAQETCREIATENRWSIAVNCDLQTLKFSGPAQATEEPAAKPPAKPAEKAQEPKKPN